MNVQRYARPPCPPDFARARKKRRKGTERPSLRPASTFSAWRIRIGTFSLETTICPRPASVGASIAARIPASHRENVGNRTSAPRAPSRRVDSMPVVRRRTGELRMLRRTRRSVRLASVKRRSTRPASAIRSSTSGIPVAVAQRRHGQESAHAREREHDRWRDGRTLEPRRHQAIGEKEQDEDHESRHIGAPAVSPPRRGGPAPAVGSTALAPLTRADLQRNEPGDQDRRIQLADEGLGDCKGSGDRVNGHGVAVPERRQRDEAEVREVGIVPRRGSAGLDGPGEKRSTRT